MMKTGLKTIYCMKLTAIYFMPIELNLEEKLDFPGTHQDFNISTSDFYESVWDFCWCRAPRSKHSSTASRPFNLCFSGSFTNSRLVFQHIKAK